MSSLALASDVDVGALLLDVVGKKLGRQVRADSHVTGGTLERTMDGASTLTFVLDDSDRTLIRSGLFDRQIDFQFDGLWWRLVKVSKQGDQLTLTFEDRAVADLRQITTPRKAARSKMTRAEFALSIVREVKAGGGIPFICPELHTAQAIAAADTSSAPITTQAQKRTDATRTAARQKGLAAGTPLTVKGAPASLSQRDLGERLLDVADSLSAPHTAAVALIESSITESTIQNLGYGDQSSLGVLQVLASTASNLGISATDPEACAHTYLARGFRGLGGAIELALKHPDWAASWVGENVMGIGEAKVNEQWKAEAEAWVAAYGGIGAAGDGTPTTATTVSRTLPYQFQRGGSDGAKEDSWTCLQRLASEVGWACFIADGACYFISETTLLKSKPRASLSEQVLGVDAIDFDVDNGKADSEATVTARAARLSFPPGSVVELVDCGPANGRWLVKDVSRGIFDAQATVTLKRATKPLPEPAAETTSASLGAGAAGSGLGAGSFGAADGTPVPELDRAYATAQAISAKRYPYVWGGGHGACGVPTGSPVGFDCSGSTCAVLAGGGLGYQPGGGVDVSGTIAARWGEPGEGRYLTVWANSEHVWMEFKGAQGPQHFGTGDWGKGWGGAGFNPRMHFKDGFTPRHWSGL